MLKKIALYLEELFCKHEWEEISHVEIYNSRTKTRIINGHLQDVDVIDDLPKGEKWTYRCKKCGAIKVKKNY